MNTQETQEHGRTTALSFYPPQSPAFDSPTRTSPTEFAMATFALPEEDILDSQDKRIPKFDDMHDSHSTSIMSFLNNEEKILKEYNRRRDSHQHYSSMDRLHESNKSSAHEKENTNQKQPPLKGLMQLHVVDQSTVKSLLYSPPKPQLLNQDPLTTLLGNLPTSPLRMFTLAESHNQLILQRGQQLQNLLTTTTPKENTLQRKQSEAKLSVKECNLVEQPVLIHNKAATVTNTRSKLSMIPRSKSKRMKSSQLIREGKLDEALLEVNALLTVAITGEDNEEESKRAMAFYLRGQILEKRGLHSQAIEDFQSALALNPSLINAAFAKAACENKIGNFEEAINTYNEAFALESSTTLPQVNNGSSYNMGSTMKTGSETATQIGGQISANRSVDGLQKINELAINKSNTSDPYVFASRIETVSPGSSSGQASFNSLSHYYKQDQTVPANNGSNTTSSKSDQHSKYGKISISLNTVKKSQARQQLVSEKSSPKIKVDQNIELFVLSPKERGNASNSTGSSKIINLSSRIERSLAGKQSNDNSTTRFEQSTRKTSTITDSSKHNPYKVIRDKRQQKSRENVQKLTRPSNPINPMNNQAMTIKKLQSHMAFIKSKQTLKPTTHSILSRQTQHLTSLKTHLNSTLKKDSAIFQTAVDSGKHKQHKRKISNYDQQIVQKLNFPQSSSNQMFMKKPSDSKSLVKQKQNVNVINISILNQANGRNVQQRIFNTQKSVERSGQRQLPQQALFQCNTSRSSSTRFTTENQLFSHRVTRKTANDSLSLSKSNDRSGSRSHSRTSNTNHQTNTLTLKCQITKLGSLIHDKSQMLKIEELMQQIESKYFNRTSDVSYQLSDQFYLIKCHYYYQNGRYQEVLDLINTQISKESDTRILKVNTLRKMRVLDSAIIEIQKYLITESLDQTNSLLGYYIKGKLMMLKGDYKSGVINFNNAQLINEADVKIYVRRAECFMRLGQFKKVDDEVETVLGLLEPTSYKYSLHLVEQLAFIPDLIHHCHQIIDKVIDQKQVSSRYYNKLVEKKAQLLMTHNKNYKEALQLLVEHIPTKTDTTLILIAQICYKLLDYEQAVQNLTQCIALNHSASYLLGKVYFKLHNYKATQDNLFPLILTQITPTQQLKALNILGTSYFHTQNYQQTIHYFTQLIQVSPSDSDILKDVYAMRGKAYQKLQMFEEAVKDFSQLIENNRLNKKTVAESLMLRAMSYEAVGMRQEYEDDMQRAIEAAYQQE